MVQSPYLEFLQRFLPVNSPWAMLEKNDDLVHEKFIFCGEWMSYAYLVTL
jgi:hypothetical protein